MWTGAADDLQRLFKVMQKQYAQLIPAHVESQISHPREMLQWSEERGGRLAKDAAEYGTDSGLAARISENEAEIKKWKEKLETAEADAQAAGNITLSLSGLNGDRTTVTGSAAQLIEYIDGKRFKSFEASSPSGDIRARRITIGADREKGIDLRVSSDDAAWCRAAFSELSEEIEKHVPRWKFVRSYTALWAFYSLLNGGAWALVSAITPGNPRVDFMTGLVSVGVASVILALVLATAIHLSRRYVPAFDLVATGGTPRGKAFLTFWGYGVGLTLVLAVVGTAISKALLG
jgi:hypothetical protein